VTGAELALASRGEHAPIGDALSATKRVAGKRRYSKDAFSGTPAWAVDVDFSATVFAGK
jgi:hypothetical protein